MIALRAVLRQFLKKPAFTLVAVLTLALGIGISVAVYSLLEQLLLHPVDFPETERLLCILHRRFDRPMGVNYISIPRFRLYRQEQTVFQGMAASVPEAMALTGTGDPVQVFGQRITSNYFDVLGVKPLKGRVFAAEEEAPGQTIVILSESFWRKRLGSDPAIIGRVLTLNGVGHTVVGVVPNLPKAWCRESDFWTLWPFYLRGTPQEELERGIPYLDTVARLKPGVSAAQAEQQLQGLAAEYDRRFAGNTDAKRILSLDSAVHQLTEDLRPIFLVLVCAAASVLLISCSNVANLLLARFSGRQRETAVRAALGASQFHILAQFLAESLVFSGVGGALGVGVGFAVLRLITHAAADLFPVTAQTPLNWTMMWSAVVLEIIVGVLSGLYPAWQATRPRLTDALKEGGRSSTPSRASKRFRAVLLCIQVAFALVLIACAGALAATLSKLQHVPIGFRSDHVFSAAVDLPPSRYDSVAARHRFAQDWTAEIRQSPDVESAAVVLGPPFANNGSMVSITRAEGDIQPVNERPRVFDHSCSPRYFETLGIPILKGRDFDDRDTPQSPKSVILSAAAAQRIFGDVDPIGRTVLLGNLNGRGEPAEVVGVVGSVRSAALRRAPEEELYRPWAQRSIAYTQVLVRTRGTPEAIAATVRRAANKIDPLLPLMRETTMERSISASLGRNRLLLTLVSVFSSVAFLLASAGVYSVVAYNVSNLTSEIGVRMALGATTQSVLILVLRQSLVPVAFGAAAGIALSFAAKSVLASQVVGISTVSPILLFAVSGTVLLGATLAALPSAIRAARIDPIKALRDE
ncbi:hypothetical protein DB347_10150 [Opitutaceae bacterium EW11]|nr:hypothetical protein DB347_10150 [Opitutaceae bacterium EW11]